MNRNVKKYFNTAKIDPSGQQHEHELSSNSFQVTIFAA